MLWLSFSLEELLSLRGLFLGKTRWYRIVEIFDVFGGAGTDVVKVEVKCVNDFGKTVNAVA